MPFPDEVVKGLFALGGGICGAAVGALIKGYFDAKARERRELTVSTTRPTELIIMARQISPRVEIRVDGKPADSLASTEVQVINTGNKAVSNMTLSIDIDGEANVISAEPTRISPSLKDVDIKSEAKRIVITSPFINPAEEIEVRLLTTSSAFKAKPVFRQPDVVFRAREQEARELPHPSMMAVFDVIRDSWILDHYFRVVHQGYRRYAQSLSKESAGESGKVPKTDPIKDITTNG